MIRTARYDVYRQIGGTREFSWYAEKDTSHLDPRTAAVLALGECRLLEEKGRKGLVSVDEWNRAACELPNRLVVALVADAEAAR